MVVETYQCNFLRSTIFLGWWRWALVSPDGVVPRRMVGVSASVNPALHHKVQKFSSGTGSPGWSRKKGRKTVVVVVGERRHNNHIHWPPRWCREVSSCTGWLSEPSWSGILREQTSPACNTPFLYHTYTRTREHLTIDRGPSTCRRSTLDNTTSVSCTTDCHFTEVLPCKTDLS